MKCYSVIDDNELKSLTLFKKQLSSYKEVNDYCESCLTPLEKEVLKEIIKKKNAFFTDISFNDNGKFITFFLPKFEEKYVKVERTYHTYKFTWKKPNGEIFFREYSYLPFFPGIKNDNYLGYTNGYGWEIINVEQIEHVCDNYEKVY